MPGPGLVEWSEVLPEAVFPMACVDALGVLVAWFFF